MKERSCSIEGHKKLLNLRLLEGYGSFILVVVVVFVYEGR